MAVSPEIVSSGWEDCRFEFPDQPGGGFLLKWIAPIFLTLCIGHWIVSVISAFLCVLILLSILFTRHPILETKTKTRLSFFDQIKLTLTGTVASVLFASAIWKFFTTRIFDTEELFFSLLQSLTWLGFFVEISLEKYYALVHAFLLQVSWIVNFLLSMFMLTSALLRRVYSLTPETMVNYVVMAITSTASLFLFVAAIIGYTDLSFSSRLVKEDAHLTEALLGQYRDTNKEETKLLLKGYHNAGIISKLSFSWMNHLLRKGNEKILAVDDIPRLGRAEDVDAAYAKLNAQWNREGQNTKFMPFIIVRAHWELFTMAGILRLINSCVMYAGPLLIQRFIDVTAKEDGSWQDGSWLVLLLLVSKGIEVVTEHQSSFINKRIGIQIWAGLVSAVYRKGLKITSARRQGHGTGNILNYMNVDVDEVSRLCQQLHDLWGLPLQICLALFILYSVLGIATLSGIGTIGHSTKKENQILYDLKIHANVKRKMST
jgi:ATP-binding cassette subfamily C (CFTR/MRP) protein 2